jgi:hypothetical protein
MGARHKAGHDRFQRFGNPERINPTTLLKKTLAKCQSMIIICSMNIDYPTPADANPRRLDSSGDPAADQAASGIGSTDAPDPVSPERHIVVLDRLSDIGVTLAEELPALARAQAQLASAVTERLPRSPPDGIPALGELAVTLHQGNVDFALMYERICRTVRRCIAMQMQVASARPWQPRPGSGRRSTTGSAAPGAASRPSAEAAARSDRPAELAGERGAERLLGDLYDRPEDPTGMADLGLDRPWPEIVAEICADFGVDGRIWAERLGLGEKMMAAPVPGTGKDRSDGGRRRADRADRYAGRPRRPMPPMAEPGAPPDTTPSASLAAGERMERPPDNHVAGDLGRIVEIGSGARNRRERRAALKLARRLPPATTHPAPASTNRRQPESGRGPP